VQSVIPYIDLPWRVLLVTPLFALFFIGVIWWAYRRESKETYAQIGELPLRDSYSTDSQQNNISGER
jgi:cbb3-type cytochrome oxidase subunit 3